MKKLHLLPLILLFTAFHFSSCSSDFEPIGNGVQIPDPGTGGGSGGSTDGTFKVDFDSQTYIATSTDGAILSDQLAINGYRGSAPNIEAVSLSVTLTDARIGTYPATDNLLSYQKISNGTMTMYTSVNPNDPEADTGSITITSIDATNHKITGTFHFTGYSDTAATKEFTNGVFTNIPYTEN